MRSDRIITEHHTEQAEKRLEAANKIIAEQNTAIATAYAALRQIENGSFPDASVAALDDSLPARFQEIARVAIAKLGGMRIMSRHTPGPWSVGDTHPRGACVHVDGPPDSYHEICTVFATAPELSAEEQLERAKADACLIAAAPDLLDGCNALLGLLQLLAGRSDISDELRELLSAGRRIDEACAAVAKATNMAPCYLDRAVECGAKANDETMMERD